MESVVAGGLDEVCEFNLIRRWVGFKRNHADGAFVCFDSFKAFEGFVDSGLNS